MSTWLSREGRNLGGFVSVWAILILRRGNSDPLLYLIGFCFDTRAYLSSWRWGGGRPWQQVSLKTKTPVVLLRTLNSSRPFWLRSETASPCGYQGFFAISYEVSVFVTFLQMDIDVGKHCYPGMQVWLFVSNVMCTVLPYWIYGWTYTFYVLKLYSEWLKIYFLPVTVFSMNLYEAK